MPLADFDLTLETLTELDAVTPLCLDTFLSFSLTTLEYSPSPSPHHFTQKIINVEDTLNADSENLSGIEVFVNLDDASSICSTMRAFKTSGLSWKPRNLTFTLLFPPYSQIKYI